MNVHNQIEHNIFQQKSPLKIFKMACNFKDLYIVFALIRYFLIYFFSHLGKRLNAKKITPTCHYCDQCFTDLDLSKISISARL